MSSDNKCFSAVMKFHPTLLLRCPYYPVADYKLIQLSDRMQEAHFSKALYLASRSLYGQLQRINFATARLNTREMLSVQKYLNRAHFRPVPFGLFSTVSVTKWGQSDGPLRTANPAGEERIDWDTGLLIALNEPAFRELTPGKRLIWNPTLYRVGNEYRFTTNTVNWETGKVEFSLQCVEDTLLADLLTANVLPGTAGDLINKVAELAELEREACEDYVHQLVRLQVIFTRDYPSALCNAYAQYSATPDKFPVIAALPDNKLPARGLDINTLLDIENHFAEHFERSGREKPANLFYVNSRRPCMAGTLAITLQQQLLTAADALCRLSNFVQNEDLTHFIQEFDRRFDRRLVPLMEALDPDTGISYSETEQATGGEDLLDGIDFTAHNHDDTAKLTWGPLQRLLLDQWTTATALGGNWSLQLRAGDFPKTDPAALPLPPSCSIMFRSTRQGLCIEAAGGATATSLMGRFAAVDEQLALALRQVTQQEQALNSGVVFAEIDFWSELHLDNVNRRPLLYDYVIVTNTFSGAPTEKQIPLSDLYLTIAGSELILFSPKLKKRVIPRLSSAYNYKRCPLPVVKFLGDLQGQGLQNVLTFDISYFFPGMDRYPRVAVEGVIINPARWYWREPVVNTILNSPRPVERLRELRVKHQLPDRLCMGTGDQQLVFNLQDPTEEQFFLSCLKGAKEVKLQEYLEPDDKVLNEEGKVLSAQFVAMLINSQRVYQPFMPQFMESENTQRSFIPGDRWLYLKIYCGPRVADELLTGALSQILKNIPASPLWFFVRYHDPEPHLRWRIRVPEDQWEWLLALLKKYLSPLMLSGHIHRCQPETYHRELERYGGDCIDQVERIFHASSVLIAHYLNLENNGFELPPAYLLGIVTVRDMLGQFLNPLEQQLFAQAVRDEYLSEFGGGKGLQVTLDKKYRQLRDAMTVALEDKDFYEHAGLNAQYEHYRARLEQLRLSINDKPLIQRTRLLADIIHMHINRLFPTEQRKQELSLYYLLHKQLVSQYQKEKRRVF